MDKYKPLYPSNFSRLGKVWKFHLWSNGENAIVRLSLEASDIVWLVPIEHKLAAQILVNDKSVFALLIDGSVKKYDLITGKELWSIRPS